MSKRVLIVDDDKDFADSLKARCLALGLEVDTASNSLTALKCIAWQRPHLICLDIQMPTGNGIDLCDFLADDPTLSRTPVIVVTGNNDSRTVRRCLELRAKYIQKSSDLWNHLRPVICDLLDLPDAAPSDTSNVDGCNEPGRLEQVFHLLA